MDKEAVLKVEKWQKAVLLYNSAYEYASIEEYDECLLLQIIILELLFLGNSEHNKKNALCNKIIPFMENNYGTDYEATKAVIENAYKKRNKLVHKGQSICYDFSTFKSLTSYQGLISGMKPFAYADIDIPTDNIKLLQNLFVLIGKIIMKY